jgi:hypothetical protein
MASGVTVADRSWQLMESAASPSSHSLDTAFDEVCRIPPEESASHHVATRINAKDLDSECRRDAHRCFCQPGDICRITGAAYLERPCLYDRCAQNHFRHAYLVFGQQQSVAGSQCRVRCSENCSW